MFNQEIHSLFEHRFKLENTYNEPQVIYMTLYTERVTDQTEYFADAFVHENVVCGCDNVMMFESLQLTPFCLEKSRVRKGYFNVLAACSVRIWLGKCKICKNNDHMGLFHCIISCQVPLEIFEHSV